MHDDGIADRIEGVFPLLLGGGHLFEESHVLQSQSEQVGKVYEIGDFVGWKCNFVASSLWQ